MHITEVIRPFCDDETDCFFAGPGRPHRLVLQSVLRLAGILRLANAFDAPRDGRIQRLDVRERDGFFVIAAQGYSPRNRRAEAIAAARHLLETIYRRPVMVKPLTVRKTNGARTVRNNPRS